VWILGDEVGLVVLGSRRPESTHSATRSGCFLTAAGNHLSAPLRRKLAKTGVFRAKRIYLVLLARFGRFSAPKGTILSFWTFVSFWRGRAWKSPVFRQFSVLLPRFGGFRGKGGFLRNSCCLADSGQKVGFWVTFTKVKNNLFQPDKYIL